MIIGVGIDLCDIKRIEKTILKFGDRFKKRCFTDNEIFKCNNTKNSAACFAKRFASKEAVSKALGTGINRGLYWKHIEIINQKSGKPEVILHGNALKILASKEGALRIIVVTNHIVIVSDFVHLVHRLVA